jgi:hypothetical protein
MSKLLEFIFFCRCCCLASPISPRARLSEERRLRVYILYLIIPLFSFFHFKILFLLSTPDRFGFYIKLIINPKDIRHVHSDMPFISSQPFLFNPTTTRPRVVSSRALRRLPRCEPSEFKRFQFEAFSGELT